MVITQSLLTLCHEGTQMRDVVHRVILNGKYPAS